MDQIVILRTAPTNPKAKNTIGSIVFISRDGIGQSSVSDERRNEIRRRRGDRGFRKLNYFEDSVFEERG